MRADERGEDVPVEAALTSAEEGARPNPPRRVASRALASTSDASTSLVHMNDRSVSGIISSSFRIFRDRLPVVITATGALQIPMFALAGFLAVASTFALNPMQVNMALSLTNFAILPIGILGLWFSEALLAQIVSDLLRGRKGSLERGLSTCWKRKGSIVSAVMVKTVLTALGTMIGMLLFVIPGIAFFIWSVFAWFFVSAVAVLEDRGGFDALRRSGSLVAHDRGKVVRYAVTMGMLLTLITLLLRVPAGLFMAAVAQSSSSLLFMQALNFMVEAVINMGTLGVGAIGMILLYFDLRMSREGWVPEKDDEVNALSPRP